MFPSTRRADLLLGLIAICAALSAAGAQRARGGEIDKVDQFLGRLGLVDLQVLHLEKTLASDRAEGDRLKLARRLADLYAARLMTAAEDPEAYDDLLRRIQALVKDYPQANTTSLQVMLLQADYHRAETQVARWIGDPTDTASRDAAYKTLARITPLLTRLAKELNQSLAALADALDGSDPEAIREAKEAQYERQAAVTGRAEYFAAWSSYYFGLLKREERAEGGEFAIARDGFRRLLGIDKETTDYRKLDPETVGLESTWRARAMIGLGLAEAAVGNVDASGACFELLEHGSVAPDIRDQAGFWYVQALISADKFEEAEKYAQPRVAAMRGDATPGSVSLCLALVRAGFGSGQGRRPANAEALGSLGLSGLARLRQFGTLYKLMEKYGIDLARDSGFFVQWIQGQRKYVEAEKSKSAADYRAAVELLSAAMRAPQARAEAASAARCRYTLGWCYYRLGEYEKAARQFETAVTGLKPSDAGDAANAAWMAFAAYRRLVEDSPRFVSAAIEALESIKREFPSHPYAKKADFEIGRLQKQAILPEEAIRSLSKVQPGDPEYLAARYELCLILYRQWSAKHDKGGDAKAELDRLGEAVDTYLKAARSDEDLERRVRCLMLVVAAALESRTPDMRLAKRYLGQARALVERLPDASAQAADYHYRSLKLAQSEGDGAAVAAHADWLVENAQGSAYEALALVLAARAAEDAVERASGEERRALRKKALEVFSRLAASLGESPEQIRQSKNALVAQSKRARYASDLGLHGEAAESLERILAAYPDDRGTLQRAAMAYYRAGEHEQSIRHWRTLLAGLEDGTDNWYEAKYYQLACLAEIDRQSARDVFEQFKLLHPSLGSPDWRPKFEALGKEL